MATNSAGPFVAATLEDAVKAGIGGAGLGTVGAAALTHTPLTVALGFAASFVVSILLSLLSQPIGDKGTNHVLSQAERVGQQLLEGIVADLAAAGPVGPPAGVVEVYPAPTAASTLPSPQTGIQPGVPLQ